MSDFFTHPDAWLGGFYELALELGPRSDERLRLALTAIWSLPDLDGPYERRDVEPSDQPRVIPTIEAVDFGHLQGLARLPGGKRAACGTFAVREEPGSDWLLLYLPMGALERVYEVGTFPFGDGSGSESWRISLDGWLREAAERVFAAAPFPLALIGHEVSGTVSAAELEGREVPAERRIGYLRREEGRLVGYPPTRY